MQFLLAEHIRGKSVQLQSMHRRQSEKKHSGCTVQFHQNFNVCKMKVFIRCVMSTTHRKPFWATSLNMVCKNLILFIATHWTKMHGCPHTANCNSSRHCTACHLSK